MELLANRKKAGSKPFSNKIKEVKNMMLDPSTTKYLIKAKIHADGIVEKPDVVGAIFGQTEGLLGEELDLRDLQKGGRIGRIEVDIQTIKGKTEGEVLIPSSLDQVITSILASALETIDRVGPCKAKINILSIEDVRVTKRSKIVERAKELLSQILEDSKDTSVNLADSVRDSVQVHEILTYGPEKLPAGPNVSSSDAIIIVEGRNDVSNLLKAGIRNAIAVEGTNIPSTVQNLSKERVVTAFVDGDRGGELVLRELLEVAEIDFIARAQRGKEVEELTSKQIMKSLRNKVPAEQFLELYSLENGGGKGESPRSRLGGTSKSDSKKKDKKKDKTPDRPPVVQPEPAPPAVIKEEPQLSDEQAILKNSYSEIVGSSKARIIGEKDNIIAEIPVKDLAETLKGQGKGVKSIVFDGIVTQRLVDIAHEHGIKSIIATKIGSISKQPAEISIMTKTDLE